MNANKNINKHTHTYAHAQYRKPCAPLYLSIDPLRQCHLAIQGSIISNPSADHVMHPRSGLQSPRHAAPALSRRQNVQIVCRQSGCACPHPKPACERIWPEIIIYISRDSEIIICTSSVSVQKHAHACVYASILTATVKCRKFAHMRFCRTLQDKDDNDKSRKCVQ